MRGIVIKFTLLNLLLSCSFSEEKKEYLFGVSNADNELKKYLIENNISEPGKVCGFFKENIKGCFKLLRLDESDFAFGLYYYEESDTKQLIQKFNPSVNYVYLEKVEIKIIRTSRALPDQKEIEFVSPRLVLSVHYFEKSTAIIFWNGEEFEEIYISD